jgi:hypothetical protein
MQEKIPRKLLRDRTDAAHWLSHHSRAPDLHP